MFVDANPTGQPGNLLSFAEVVLNIIVAILATTASAFLAQLLTRESKSEKDAENRKAEQIAETVRSEREGRAAAVAEVLAAQAIAANPTAEQVRQIVRDTVLTITLSDSVSKPVEQLINNYHEQALSQARIQFWFSVIAATTGFCWILYGGTTIQPDKLVTVSKTFPGIVMDAVAFLFFRQAAATRERATELYDRLRRDKQLAESSAIVNSIEDSRLRSAVKAQLALHMSGLKPKDIDFGAFLSAENPNPLPLN